MNERRARRITGLPVPICCLLLGIAAFLTACNPPADSCTHAEGAWILDREATYDSAGQRHTACDLCGEILRRETIPRKTCTHPEAVWEEEAPTPTEDGSRRLTCPTCEKTLETEILPALGLTEEEISQRLRDCVVKVTCYDYDGVTQLSQGSGFFIDDRGTFITNAHVVKNAYYAIVQTADGETRRVDAVCVYKAADDYALCRVEEPFASTAVTFASDAEPGDRVYALGYPNGADEVQTTSGVVTDSYFGGKTKRYYSTTASIDFGSSGGILADARGRVLGITTGVFSNGDFAALKYREFKADVNHIPAEGRDLLTYFHKVERVDFSDPTADLTRYLDVSVQTEVISPTEVLHTVTVKRKDAGKDIKMRPEDASVSLRVVLNTAFTYTESTAEGSVTRTETGRNSLTFSFSDGAELMAGVTQTVRCAVTPGEGSVSSPPVVTCEAVPDGGSGVLLVFDP